MTEKPEEKKEPSQDQKLRDLLSNWKGAPSLDQIEAWKLQHGSVFLTVFDEQELYVFRPITRSEHRDLNRQIAEQKKDADSFEESVVLGCTLWSSQPLAKIMEQKAGTTASLFEQVMSNSNFLPSVALMNLVIKL